MQINYAGPYFFKGGGGGVVVSVRGGGRVRGCPKLLLVLSYSFFLGRKEGGGSGWKGFITGGRVM